MKRKALLLLILISAFILLIDIVGAQRAMLAYYDSGTPTIPRYRTWDGSSWSAELSANDVGGTIEWIVLKACPKRNEYILGTLDANGHVNVQVWQNGVWSSVLEVTTGIGTTYDAYRGFDIAYEQSSGDAIIVYNDGTTTPKYRIWNGTVWSAEASVSVIGTGIPVWIVLASNPKSDEIILATVDTNDDIYAQVWSGSAWGNAQLMETNTESYAYQGVDVAYEYGTGRALVVWSDDADDNPQYRIWDGTSWSAEGLANDVGPSTIRWVKLASDPSSNQILLGTLDGGRDVNVQVWSGSAWGSVFEVTAGAETNVHRAFDVAWENSTGVGMVSYGESIDTPRYRTCSGTNCFNGIWSAELSANDVNPGAGDPEWIRLEPDVNSNNIFLMHADDANDIGVQRWDTSIFTDATNVELSSRNNFEAFDIAWKQDITPPTITIIAPGDGANVSGLVYINASIFDVKSGINSSLVFANVSNSTDSFTYSMSLYQGDIYNGNWSVLWDTTALADGYYNITVNATDNSQNSNVSAYITVYIDNTPPSVTNINPPDGTIVSSIQEINATVVDNYVGVSTVYAVVSNTTYSAIYTMTLKTGNVWNYSTWNTSELVDGRYNITINASDILGNYNDTEYVTVVVDNYKPIVTLVSPTPSNNSILDTSWLYINVTLNEEGSVALLELNGVNYTMNQSTTTNFWANLSLTSLYGIYYAGNYTFKVYANDTANNWNVSETRTITVKGRIDVEGITSLAPSNITTPSYNVTMLKFNLTAKGENISISSLRVKKTGNYPYTFVNVSVYWDTLGNTISSSNTSLQADDVLLAGPVSFASNEYATMFPNLMVNVTSPVTLIIVYDVGKIE